MMEKSEPRVTADALKRKREREQEIVSQMIALYCKGNHSAHGSASLRERGGEIRQMREGAALRERDSGGAAGSLSRMRRARGVCPRP